MKPFITNLNVDEVREGFFVNSHRKKLWNVQIQLILEVDRICRKHNLKYFAQCGTLLGAVRHKGFIPWDDDVDLAMPRPDYNKFMEIAPSELNSNYFLDLWYNYRLEEELTKFPSDDPSDDEQLPIVSNEVAQIIREKKWWWPIRACYAKLRDSSTAMIQWPSRKNFNQGIWIDIFPIDPVPPFENETQDRNYAITKELRLIAGELPKVREMLAKKEPFVLPEERIKQLLEMPFRDRALAFEKHMTDTYFEAPNMSVFILFRGRRRYKPEFFAKTVELPFEETVVVCPAMYEEALTAWYGDWRKIVFRHGHAVKFSADIPYKEFFASVTK